MKSFMLVVHGLIYILFLFFNYATSSLLVVPYEYSEFFQKFSLFELLLMILIQVVIMVLPKGDFGIKFLIQLFSFISILALGEIIILYIDNLETSYPVWSDIIWLSLLEIGMLFLFFYLGRKLLSKSAREV